MLHGRDGFSLVWIAAALVVASLAIATLISSKDARSVWDPQLATHEQLADIEDALVKFQRGHHRLPCPAPRDQLPDSINFGIEAVHCHTVASIAGTQRVDTGSGVHMRIGVLPVRTLGLDHKYHGDKWGNRFTYVVVERLTDPYQFSDTTGTLRLTDGKGATILTNGAFAVISHGADGKGAYTLKGGVQGKSCTSAAGTDQENCNNDRVFTKRIFHAQKGADYYDDTISVLPVDTQAQSMNIPCYPPRTPTPFAWNSPSDTDASCSAPFPNMLHDTTETLTNSNADNSGQAIVRCNNGVLQKVSGTCNYTRQCLAGTQGWAGAVTGCSAPQAALNNKDAVSLTNAAAGRNGSVTLTCRKGVITQSGGTCNGNSCTRPWGGSVAHGGSTGAFAASSVPCGSTCASEVRYCNFGVLSGSYSNGTCSATACKNCTSPWGATVAHNSSIPAYNASSVPCGSSCASQNRSCWNGTLSGSYTAQSCAPQACAACNRPWGGTTPHGGSITAYNTSVGCGTSCTGQTRQCNNGTFTGSYTHASCTPGCANCSLPWGGQIAHGQNVQAYANANPGCGDTCHVEQRSCNNGSLSGSHTAGSCSHPANSCMMNFWGCTPTAATHFSVSNIQDCYNACLNRRNTSGIAGCCLYMSNPYNSCAYFSLSTQTNAGVSAFFYSRTFW